MTTVKAKIIVMTCLGLVAAGCSEPFDPASLIDNTRVLGARVEVVGDPGRSTPRPGETATVAWLVEAPGAVPPLAWAFVVCPSASATALTCAAEPFLARRGTGQPRFDLTVPAVEALAGVQRLLVIGQICAGSEPVLDQAGGAASCAPGGSGTTATVDLPLARDTEVNRNPTLRGRPVWLGDAPWDEDATGCGALPRVAAGSSGHVMRVQALDEDRERFIAMVGDPPVPVASREMLQISQFATAGEMGAAYAFIESGDVRSPVDLEMKWNAPKPEEVPAEGLEVRFTFVQRDLRGGVDWTQRSLCVTK